MEVGLKAIGFQYINDVDERKKFVKETRHNLSEILNVVKDKSDLTRPDEEIEWLKKYFDDLSQIDRESDSFRYPFHIVWELDEWEWKGKFAIKSIFNSRIFCTRWNGIEKGSIFDDALDDKEYEGNLIYLLQSGCDFVRNNSKVRFVKEARYRIDKPDYAERAVTEVIVNALIYRDYIVLGSEIHIDMYDDRIEIQSPGGMFEGMPVQELVYLCLRNRSPRICAIAVPGASLGEDKYAGIKAEETR